MAFGKLENVKSSFKLVVEEIQEVCEQLSLDSSEVEEIDELCSNFQNTYIEKNLRESLFPPSIWNKREAASEGVARTTNAVEGWHPSVLFGLASKSVEKAGKFEEGCCNPNVPLFAVNSRYGIFEKKYQKLGAKVKNAIERHQDENTIAFLRAMASLSMSN